MQPEVNIGLFGHVDHGKTTLVKAITGVWTSKHSEEIKKEITIRIGYADVEVYYCPKCGRYQTSNVCEVCNYPTEFKRKISFVDAPGHESLMATAISASSIVDGALLLIAANEECPQEQTKEHLMLLDMLGIKNIVIVQTKVDLVSKEEAMKNYMEIKEFVKGTAAENAPIIPVVSHYKINIHYVLEAIEKIIPTPKRDENKEFTSFIPRSFDVNKPGTPIKELKGGVLGASIVQGKVKVGDKIVISPGIKYDGKRYRQIETKVVSLKSGSEDLKEAKPGGLIALGTLLDPALTKADSLAGHIITKAGNIPPVSDLVEISYQLLNRKDITNIEIKPKDVLLLNIHTYTTAGVVLDVDEKNKKFKIKLKRPTVVLKGSRIAISKIIGNRWRLIGLGRFSNISG